MCVLVGAHRSASDGAVPDLEQPHVYSMLGSGTAMRPVQRPSTVMEEIATRRTSVGRRGTGGPANLQMRKRFSCLKTVADAPAESKGERLVRLQRKIPGQSLGFTLKTVAMASLKCATTSKQNPTFIETVDPTGIAYASGLRAGDHILRIDGEECANAKHAHLVNLLKSNEGVVQYVSRGGMPVLPVQLENTADAVRGRVYGESVPLCAPRAGDATLT